MKKYKLYIILINLVLLLVYFNYSISKQENLLKSGRLILLELTPVDPRSLIQGDYMMLRYSISDSLNINKIPKRGYCVVQLDKNGIAKRVRLQSNTTPLHQGEYLIKYSSSDKWNINIGAESYFFQEGEADKYEPAKYGGLKLDDNGNSLLVGLYDAHLKKIE